MLRTSLKPLAFVFVALILVSCSLLSPGGPIKSAASETPDLVQTLTALAPTGEAPSDTPAVVPSDTSAPVVTAIPAATNTRAPASTSTGVPVVQITPIAASPTSNMPTPIPPNLIRLNFAANATDTAVFGAIAGGTAKAYVLRVLGGQVMMVNVSSGSQDVFLRIYGLTSGQVLLDAGMGIGLTSWQGRVPSTQDYVIMLLSRGGNTNFSLGITIPENIVFQAGAISASRSYPIAARDTHAFMLRASAGQTMTLTLTPTDQSVLLAFYGYQDGQPYLRSVAGQTSWTGTVPATQDYIIQVVSVVDNAANFTLNVKIQ